MSIKWTESQQKAIDTRNSNVIVSAAAGSGKTAVLVQRVIEILSDETNPVRADELIVMTFTNAAAAEMRERIQSALAEKIEKTPENVFLKEQLIVLGQAQISTIHSLCLNLIKDNFHMLNIRHDFEIADESKLSPIRKAAMENVLDNQYKIRDKDFLNTVDCFGGKRNDDEIIDIIYDIYNFSQSLPTPEKWLDKCIETLKDCDAEKYLTIIKNSTVEKLLFIISQYKNAVGIIECDEGLLPYYDTFKNELCIFENLYSLIIKNAGIDNSLIVFGKLPRKKNNADEQNTKTVKQIRDNAKKLLLEIESINNFDSEDLIYETEKIVPFVRVICNLVKEYTKEYIRLKTEENVFDFSDLEHYAVKLLEENQEFCSMIRNKYKEILVDEYQDTSGIQDRLFDLLSNGKNLFVVGDVKQSIYNFRNSNPKFFMQKYNNYSLNKEKGQKIILSENFRSSSGVIDFINNLFSEIMTERTGGVNYNDEHSLKYNNKTVKDFKVPADINIIQYDSKSIENMEDENSISDKHIAEARFIAQRIIEIVEVEKPEIYDGRIDGYRAVTYGDIAVLMRRTRGVASAFANEFISYGIPVFTQETGSYFMTVEIATVISYLKIIENPLQDVPMLAVMRSPIFGFDDNSIANLRADNPKTSLYMMLKSSDDEKAVSFIKNLDELIELEKYKSVDYIVRKIIFDTGYYQFAGNLPNGSARMANLELLCKRASDFVKKGYKSIFNFIRYINNMIENEEEYSSARLVSEGENVVNIMTIHKSKGLEFPIVFLAGCGDRFNKIDFIKPYIYDEELGMITNIVDKERRLSYKSVFQKAVILKKKEEIMSEEIRLLYVAVTRAKYKIIISAVSSKAAEKAQRCEKGIRDIYTLKNSDSYIDIILSTGNFKKINVIDSTTLKIPEKTSVKLSDESVNADYSQYYNEIDRRLKYIYPYAKSKNIPSKKSISEIVSGSDDIIHLDKIKGRDKSLSSAQKGTIVHYVLQNLNLCNVDSITSIDGQIDKMISDGMLSSDFKQYIDTDAIYGFFASDIGKRMLRSDKIYREFKFCVDVPAVDIGYDVSNETVLIQGVIDCCFYEDGEYVIIDYKTGSMQEKYKVQLELYKKCLSIATGKNVRETCIYPLI